MTKAEKLINFTLRSWTSLLDPDDICDTPENWNKMMSVIDGIMTTVLYTDNALYQEVRDDLMLLWKISLDRSCK